MNIFRFSMARLLAAAFLVVCGGAMAQTLPLLTIQSFSWTEQNAGTTQMPVTLSLSFANNTADVAGFVSAGQTAVSGVSPFALATPGASCVPGVDFVEVVNRPFTIARGTLSTTFNVTICGDQVVEQNENFRIGVATATLVGARCPNTSGGCASVPTIVNDDVDNLIPVVRIDDVRIQEPASGTVNAVLTVRLSRPASQDSVVSFATQSDTASGVAIACSGKSDFLHRSGTVNIPAGQITATINVPICADNVAESDQRFFIVLSNASSHLNGIADGRGEVTITANGGAVGTFQISPDRARVKVDEHQTFSVIWTVPEGDVWRDLNTIDMRVRDDEHTVLWVRWNEDDNMFSLCSKTNGPKPHGAAVGKNGKGDDALSDGIPENGCSTGALPGSDTVLETRYARLHLARTSVVGSGPLGREVTLNIDVSFKAKAIGVHEIELAASNDVGALDDFTTASAVRVLRNDGK